MSDRLTTDRRELRVGEAVWVRWPSATHLGRCIEGEILALSASSALVRTEDLSGTSTIVLVPLAQITHVGYLNAHHGLQLLDVTAATGPPTAATQPLAAHTQQSTVQPAASGDRHFEGGST
jgi:hypothetical protein